MNAPISIGIVGDFNAENHTHRATNEALEHAAARQALPLRVKWLHTTSVLAAGGREQLGQHDALWLAPASPYASMEGALAAVEFARRRDWPFTAS